MEETSGHTTSAKFQCIYPKLYGDCFQGHSRHCLEIFRIEVYIVRFKFSPFQATLVRKEWQKWLQNDTPEQMEIKPNGTYR